MKLKEQIKGELLKQKEEQLKKEKEINSELKEIILYTRPNNPVCTNYKNTLTEKGIKFKEKDLTNYTEVISTTQNPTVPIIEVNDNYLVNGRDFLNVNQCIQAIRHYASPDYVNPPTDRMILESLKNLNAAVKTSLQGLNRQLAPIVKIMNELAKEENEEKNN